MENVPMEAPRTAQFVCMSGSVSFVGDAGWRAFFTQVMVDTIIDRYAAATGIDTMVMHSIRYACR